MHFDVGIVGAGPVGLSLAISLARGGHSVALVEKQAIPALADPAFDGREIALTDDSKEMLQEMGVWQALPPDAIHALQTARVLNGSTPHGLFLQSIRPGRDRLATLVSNCHIRAALFRVAGALPGIEFFAGDEISDLALGKVAALELRKAGSIAAQLLVAADSRLSGMRRSMGIEAEMRQLGQAMMTFRVEHEAPHEQAAMEWFAHRHTVAALPLAGRMSSLIVTMPEGEIGRLARLPEKELARKAEHLSGHRLGRLRIASTRHVYPLVMTYARRFSCARGALAGDAAVGMHPVTAHGFNFGLRGQKTLAEEIHMAAGRGQDIGSRLPLLSYERRHWRATRPLYLATNALVRLYTDESPLGRGARELALQAASRLPLVPQAISAVLGYS